LLLIPLSSDPYDQPCASPLALKERWTESLRAAAEMRRTRIETQHRPSAIPINSGNMKAEHRNWTGSGVDDRRYIALTRGAEAVVTESYVLTNFKLAFQLRSKLL